MAYGRVAARHCRAPLPARSLLARGGILPADLGAARYGGHAARRRLLWRPLGAALPRRRRWGLARPPGGAREAALSFCPSLHTPAMTFGLVRGQ